MKIKVSVTKDVLERSKMCSSKYASNCAIAIAFRDLFPNAECGTTCADLFGQPDNVCLDKTSPSLVYLPESASIFIKMFDSLEGYPDQRLLMSPFSFEIEVPEYVISKIGIGEIYRVLSESKTLELVMQDFGQTGQS